MALSEEGAHAVIASRTRAELETTAGEIREKGGIATPVPADVTDERQVERLVGEVRRTAGRIDILVNNAGIGVFKPVREMTAAEFERMWRVNLLGVFLVTRAVLPAMQEARKGAIVTIASLAGKNTFKGGAGYCATKWGLRGFAGSLMLEVRDDNIRVVTLFPGSVDTAFSAQGKKGKSITQPEDVASAVVFAVTAPDRSMFSEIDVRPTRPA
jgi:NADP-dependent 3-hydroxy acid dehydrogenase YdfG